MKDTTKRILVFSFAYSPYEGGAEIALRKITEYMKDVSFHVVTFQFDAAHPKKEAEGNVTIHRISSYSRLLFPFVAASFAQKLHKKEKFTHIWSIMANYAGFAALFFKKKHPHIPFVLTLQEGDPIHYIKRKVWFVYPWFKQIFKKADEVHAISSYLAQFAHNMGFVKEVHVIPNGVDEAFISGEVYWPRHTNKDPILITTSRLVKKNAVDDIVRALVLLPEHIQFHIVGGGKEKASIENLIEKYNLSQRVKFFGNVPYEDLPRYLKEADVYIRPSRSEGLGSAFLEAMGVGLPIIGTHVGGIVDFLQDKKTGFVCKVNSPASIADVVKTILDDDSKALVKDVVLEANRLIKEHYLWTRVARQMEALFQ